MTLNDDIRKNSYENFRPKPDEIRLDLIFLKSRYVFFLKCLDTKIDLLKFPIIFQNGSHSQDKKMESELVGCFVRYN